ncbi:MAG: hypothetical protein J6I76_17735 [Oribacterium sp.]|nr:hypothetical protein [Oribacterium sp.]
MKFHKTNQNNRNSIPYRYTLTDEKGREYEVRGAICPGEDGVTQADIDLYYKDEDDEVENNIRNARQRRRSEKEKRQIKEWRERFIKDFMERYGYAPGDEYVDFCQDEVFPKNWSLSLDSSAELGIDEDENLTLNAPSVVVPYEDIVMCRQIMEIAASILNEKNYEIFHRVYVGNELQKDVASDLDMDPRQVNKSLKRSIAHIQKKLGIKK